MVEYKDRLTWGMKKGPKAPITIRQLSAHLGLSYQGVRKVVLGESNAFTVVNHEKAARFLMLNSRWLATGAGERLENATTHHTTTIGEEQPATYQANAIHSDAWIAEAIQTLEAMTPEDRRAAVLNLRVFTTTLSKPGGGQALSVAA